jgi:hypothetical protein
MLQHVIDEVYDDAPPMHMTKPGRALFLLSVVSAPVVVGSCAPLIKRDLSTIPQGQIGFDDMCGLQDYFDGLEAKVSREPVVVSSLDLEGGDGKKTMRGGRARLLFEGNYLVKNGKRVLNENWMRLPEELEKAEKFEVEVRWAERAGVRRVVTDEDAELIVGNTTASLPYHVCLSEWLYGAPLYKQRQLLWGLPNPSAPPPAPVKAATPIDGGVPDGAPPADGAPAPAVPQTATK